MKKFIIVLSFLCFSCANAQNTNITIDVNLNLNCAFEKVILKNPDHNFETFTKDQIKRGDISKLVIESKSPNVLNIKNLSNFVGKIELEVKISNKDVVLIQAFDEERNYSESAVLTIKTGELVHEITKNIKLEQKEKDISFYSCKNINQNT
jgi:predicted signal transduction protein with EAL and GGDEF domain